MSIEITRIFLHANPSSKIHDLRALFDSYCYRFSTNAKTFVEAPLWTFAVADYTGLSPRYSEKPRPPKPALGLRLEDPNQCTGTLLHGGGPIGDDPRTSNERWPFWVESDLQLQFWFRVKQGGVLIQEFLFEPGKKYEEETVRGFME